MPDPRLQGTFPLFPVPDVEAAARFWARVFGFEVGFFPQQPPYGFALLERDGSELALKRVPPDDWPAFIPRRPPDAWHAYVRTRGVRGLFEQTRDALAEHGGRLLEGPVRRSYGDLEIVIEDPLGYVVAFGGDVEG